MFVNVQDAIDYLCSLQDTSGPEVWKPLIYRLYLTFVAKDLEYTSLQAKYIKVDSKETTASEIKYFDFNFNILTTQPYLQNYFQGNDPQYPHQLAVIFPNALEYKITNQSFIGTNHTHKTSMNRDIGEQLYQFLLPAQYCVKATFMFHTKDLSERIHDILMSDCMFSHPENTYWITGLNMSMPHDKQETRTVQVVCKTQYKGTKLLTKVTVNNRVVASKDGIPVLMYFLDQEYHVLQYDWFDKKKTLPEIIKDTDVIMHTAYTENESRKTDIKANATDIESNSTLIRMHQINIDNLTKTDATVTSLIHTITDEDIIDRMERLETMTETLGSITIDVETSSSIWGDLLGGVAGGALGALGTAFQTVVQAKGALRNTIISAAAGTFNNLLTNAMGSFTGASLEARFAELGQRIQESDRFQSIINTAAQTTEDTVQTTLDTVQDKIKDLFNMNTDQENKPINMPELETKIETNTQKINTFAKSFLDFNTKSDTMNLQADTLTKAIQAQRLQIETLTRATQAQRLQIDTLTRAVQSIRERPPPDTTPTHLHIIP